MQTNKIIKRTSRTVTGFLLARYFFAKALIGFAACTLVSAVFLFGGFDKFELVTLDQRFKARPERPTDKNIAIIEMADDGMETIGRWPWPREWHAALLSILKKCGAKLVLFDVIFDKESAPSQDAVFRQAIKSAGNVYLPFVFQFKTGDMPARINPSENVRNIIYPMQEFLQYSRGRGHVNVAPDVDGKLRRVPLIIKYGDKLYPHIALKAAADYVGARDRDIIVKPGKSITLKNTSLGNIEIPLGPDNEMLVSWAGTWKKTFKHYSYIDIIYRIAIKEFNKNGSFRSHFLIKDYKFTLHNTSSHHLVYLLDIRLHWFHCEVLCHLLHILYWDRC